MSDNLDDDSEGYAEFNAWVERLRDASLRTILLDFRKEVGRPMDDWELAVTTHAHRIGWVDGITAMGRDLAQRRGEEGGAP